MGLRDIGAVAGVVVPSLAVAAAQPWTEGIVPAEARAVLPIVAAGGAVAMAACLGVARWRELRGDVDGVGESVSGSGRGRTRKSKRERRLERR